MTIVENLQRDDLSALEQAEAFRILSKEFQLTQAQIGERVGLSRETVSNYMRLLKLPEVVMEQLATKQFGFSEARELLKLEDAELITKTADYIVKKHLTLDQLEMLIMRMTGLADPVPGMPGADQEEERGAVGGSECEGGAIGDGAAAGSEGEDPRPEGSWENRH